METLLVSSSDDIRLSRTGQKTCAMVTPSGCHHPRTSSPLRTNRPDISAYGRTRPRRAEPSPRVRVDCRRARTEPVASGLAAPPEQLPLPTEPLCEICPKAAPLLPHSVGLRTGSIRVLMISVLAPAVAAADADAVVAEPNHPHTEGRHPANVEWLEHAKRRTPL